MINVVPRHFHENCLGSASCDCFSSASVSVNLYRAGTQSITTDEAYTYIKIVGAERFALFSPVEANYHVLHSLLCYVSVHTFGLSLFSLDIRSHIHLGFRHVLPVLRY